MNDHAFLENFLRGEADEAFHHEQHVRAGFALLEHHAFAEALTVYSAALKRMASRAGKPEAYNETITVAFLALIAEHQARGRCSDFTMFARRNPELLDKSLLDHWYSRERLTSALARKTFLMPEASR